MDVDSAEARDGEEALGKVAAVGGRYAEVRGEGLGCVRSDERSEEHSEERYEWRRRVIVGVGVRGLLGKTR